jgi:hypothetical protein
MEIMLESSNLNNKNITIKWIIILMLLIIRLNFKGLNGNTHYKHKCSEYIHSHRNHWILALNDPHVGPN